MLKSVPDPRRDQGKQYALEFVLMVCVVAALAGTKNYREMATCAACIAQPMPMKLGARWDWFKFCRKVPCAGTIRLVLTAIDAAELDRITCAWLFTEARRRRNDNGDLELVIAVDGKVMRGA